MVKSQPKTIKKQVCNVLEAVGRQVTVSPLLQTQHLKAQQKFAADNMDKEKNIWRKTLWSDETKIVDQNEQQCVCRREGEALNPMSNKTYCQAWW